jgi:hypothetical protein
MTQRFLLAAGLLAAFFAASGNTVHGGDPLAMTEVWSYNFSMDRPWHGPYYAQQYGQPLAVVVPPTAHMRQTYSWGVSQNLMYPIHHQFGRSANQPGAAPMGSFRPTPPWPSHTDQFGYSYVRGPWK